MNKFDIYFLEDAVDFLDTIDEKARNKIYTNIEKAAVVNDPELFKKLTSDIWEFRTKYNGIQYRLFAFWDKRNNLETLVVTTHGFIKKTQKTPKSQIEKAEKLRAIYFDEE